MVTLVKLLHPENAPSPILVTLSGIVMFVRLVQLENAQPPILVTPSSMVTLVTFSQPLNSIILTGIPLSFVDSLGFFITQKSS